MSLGLLELLILLVLGLGTVFWIWIVLEGDRGRVGRVRKDTRNDERDGRSDEKLLRKSVSHDGASFGMLAPGHSRPVPA